ncbi:hypothetical protein BHE74_00053510 [Ensete ventricosum]|nr:hypothetical protein BHE74_00053510 [Ensete ventricosum]RZS09567.1 hypothetical protein BHM03_00040663 [Ensete ventricosum]
MACGIAAAELFRRFSLEDSCDEEDKDDGHGQQKELEEVQARRPRGDWIVEEDGAAAGAANGKGERATRNTSKSFFFIQQKKGGRQAAHAVRQGANPHEERAATIHTEAITMQRR